MILKKISENILKGTITSLIGVTTMIITLVLLWTRAIDFVWNGVAGLCIGCILLLAPKAIETSLVEFIKAWGRRASDMFSGFGGFGFGGRIEGNEEKGKDPTDNGEGNQKP